MPENAKKPQIRFKGFTDDWEQRKLGEIANKVLDKNIGLQYVETLTNSAEYGIISQREFFDHNISKIESLEGYYIVQNNDFVYNPRISTTAPVGPINRNKLGRSGVMSPLYTVFRVENVDFTFLEYFFKTNCWHAFMNYNGDSGARSDRFSIKDNIFFEMPIVIPRIEEQIKIGKYMLKLDNLITLHQRKYFCSNNLIFTITTAWEQRKLGDCFAERNESMPEGELISVTINEGIKKFSELGRHNNSNEDKTKYKKVCISDIAYNSMRMWQGASGYSPYEGIVSPAYTVLVPNAGIDSKCLSYQIKLPYMIHIFQINSQGITSDNWNLKYPVLSQIEIFISKNIEEQRKISNLFDNLDNLITLHQRECFFIKKEVQNVKFN